MAPKASTSRLPADELRRRRRALIDEDDDSPSVLPARGRQARPSTSASTTNVGKRKATARASTPPPSARAPSSALPASPSIAVKFAGKVYRTLDTQMEGVTYGAPSDFLGEPDEEVGDAERERADRKRREMQRKMLVEASSPGSKGKRRAELVLSDDEDKPSAGAATKRGRTSSNLATPVKQQLERPIELSSPRQKPLLSGGLAPSALGLPFAFREAASSSVLAPLPQPLANLVALHSAIEGSLIMHLSTAGSSVASTSTAFDVHGRATVRIPNLIDLPELSKMVKCGRQQFGQRELERLVWAWEGCGEDLDDEEDDLRVVESGTDGTGEEVGGLGFLVSRKRIGKGGNIQSTYGIGISVKLKANPQLPKFELLPHSPSQNEKVTPLSPSSVGRGREGMNVVALWTQGKDARREELHRRLRAWGKRCAREEQTQASPVYDPSLAAFPVVLPAIPRAVLPTLSPALPSIPGTLSPSPKKKVPSDVFGPAVPIAGPTKGSVLMLLEGTKDRAPSKTNVKASERNRLMRERLAAKHAEAQKPPTNHAFLSTLSGGTFSTTKKSLRPEKEVANDYQTMEREMYKRNAMVSRLGNVADVVVMLSIKCHGRPVLLHEVSAAVSNSPLVKIGEDEAHSSLHLLCELFPDFSQIKSIDRQDWLYLQRDAKAVDVKIRVHKELEEVRNKSGSYGGA